MDVMASDWECTLERMDGQADHAVRIGLRYLKGLGRGDWERIQEWRAATRGSPDRPTLSGFTSACRLPRDSMERLAEVGAFDSLGVARRPALWGVLEPGPPVGEAADLPTRLLVAHEERSPAFRSLSPGEEITWDYEASDQSPRGHLMERYRPWLQKQGLPDAAEVSRMEHGKKVSFAGGAICRQMPGTASGVLFMTLEDETGFANLVVWDKVFREHRSLILTSWFLGVTGRLQVAEGVVHIIAESFWKPELPAERAPAVPASHDFR